MSISPLLQAAAIPVARVAIQTAVQTAQGIGSQFAQWGAASPLEAETAADASPGNPLGTVQEWADKLRGWLRDQGVDTSEFQVGLQLAADGTTDVQVSGRDADAIRQLLSEHPNWLEELRNLATGLQLPSASPSGGLPPVTLSVSESDWSAAFTDTH